VTIRIVLLVLLMATNAIAQQSSGNASPNSSIDPEHIFFTQPVNGPVTDVTEPVQGSDIPLHLIYVETRDGLYAPIGLRKPLGNGPFPIILFAHMKYEDAISIIKFVKTLPYVDPNRVGYLGLSHGGEMLMKIASEYDGLRAGIASEPASIDFLARRPQPRDPNAPPPPETMKENTGEMQHKTVEELRGRIDMSLAMSRINAIKTAIFVQERDRDHHQDIFRLNYELLHDAGKDVQWKSYDDDEHGFIFVRRDPDGVYRPNPVQLQIVKDSIAYFDRYMKNP